jgi:hypothetical protein
MTALIAVILIYNFGMPESWYWATAIIYAVENGIRLVLFMAAPR